MDTVPEATNSKKRGQGETWPGVGVEAHGAAPVDVLPVMFPLRKGTLIGGGPWRLAQDTAAEIRLEGTDVVAVHPDTDEYGIGKSQTEAVADLLVSLADYLVVLERRRDSLAPRERRDLELLTLLMEK